jgi:hypothetical protein
MPLDQCRRREFIKFLSSAAATFPLAKAASASSTIDVFNPSSFAMTCGSFCRSRRDIFLAQVCAEQLGLLLEISPEASAIVHLRNPANPIHAETETRALEIAGHARRIRLSPLNVTNLDEVKGAFEYISRECHHVVVSTNKFFHTRFEQLCALAEQYSIIMVGANALIGLRERMVWEQAVVSYIDMHKSAVGAYRITTYFSGRGMKTVLWTFAPLNRDLRDPWVHGPLDPEEEIEDNRLLQAKLEPDLTFGSDAAGSHRFVRTVCQDCPWNAALPALSV